MQNIINSKIRQLVNSIETKNADNAQKIFDQVMSLKIGQQIDALRPRVARQMFDQITNKQDKD